MQQENATIAKDGEINMFYVHQTRHENEVCLTSDNCS